MLTAQDVVGILQKVRHRFDRDPAVRRVVSVALDLDRLDNQMNSASLGIPDPRSPVNLMSHRF